jgi:hypothetical protein
MGCGTTSRAGLEPATPGLDDDDVERPEVYRPGVPPMWCSSMSATNLKKITKEESDLQIQSSLILQLLHFNPLKKKNKNQPSSQKKKAI